MRRGETIFRTYEWMGVQLSSERVHRTELNTPRGVGWTIRTERGGGSVRPRRRQLHARAAAVYRRLVQQAATADEPNAEENAMIQLNPPIPLMTAKGQGLAHFLLDYGPEFDLFWTVFLDETGECWTFNNRDIRACKNITLGRGQVSAPRPAPSASAVMAAPRSVVATNGRHNGSSKTIE